jgi:septal ring factor EnvC (AmiA/AmiB activator)
MRQLKLLLIVLVSLLGTSLSFGQTKKELQMKVQELSITVVRHEAQIQIMEKSISDLTNKMARLEAQLEIFQLQNNRIENNIYQPNQNQPSITPQPQTRPSAPSSIRSQCRGITKAGNRCKRSAGPNGYCYQHGN